MGWKEIGKGGGSDLPLVKITEKGIRVRFIGPNVFSDITGTKYADGPIQRWSHWAPDDLKEAAKGPIPCLGIRKGCIFHEEPLKWDSQCANYVNVILYEDVDAKARTYGSRKIQMIDLRNKVGQQIQESAGALGVDIDEVDWMLTRSGKGMTDTTYTATAIQRVLESEITLEEFEANEAYPDDDLPQIIDPAKFNGDRPKTPAEQEAWYEKLSTDQEEVNKWPPADEEEDGSVPKGIKALPGKKAAAPPVKGKAPISLPKRNAAPAAKPAAAPAKIPPKITPKGATKPPIIAKKESAYDKALKVLDPQGEPLHAEHEHLEFYATFEGNLKKNEYGITAEIVEAAQTITNGPEEEAAPAKKTPPRVKAAPEPEEEEAEEAEEEAEEGESDVAALQQQVTQYFRTLPTLKNLKNGQKFLKQVADVKSIGEIDDVETLEGIITLCEGGDEAVADWLA